MKKKSTTSTSNGCPCGGISYASCCQPFHLGSPAPSALTLMRSRYSAYVLELEPYLLATWHPDTRPDTLDLHQEATTWLGLEIKRQETSGDAAIVEFVARYKLQGRAYRMQETSRFLRTEESWFYVDGEFK